MLQTRTTISRKVFDRMHDVLKTDPAIKPPLMVSVGSGSEVRVWWGGGGGSIVAGPQLCYPVNNWTVHGAVV